MSADIFISFASQDAKIANTISAAIESRGFKCWISSRDILPGENFQSAIVRAIRTSKILLLVFTSNSNRSDEMTKELALASQQKLMVVPLRVEDVTPSDAFAYEFATRQWIDLFADWELAMNQLCTRLGAALANEPHPTDTIVLGKPAAEAPAPRPVPTLVTSNPARATGKAAAPAGAKAAAGPRSPLLKVAIGAAALIAAAAVAVPTLMKRPATTAAPATAAATEPAVVVAVAPTAGPSPADQTATSTALPIDPAPTAPIASATAPGPAGATAAPAAPALAAATDATATTGRDAVSKELSKEPAKPVERKKRVAAQRSSSNVPY